MSKIATMREVLERSEERERKRTMRAGMKYNKWSRDDHDKLVALYPIASNDELQRAFPGRSLSSILSMANNLGVVRPRRRDWKTIAAAHVPTVVMR
jgi:hypothetical protein